MGTSTGDRYECVVAGADILGEVPMWCDRTRLLWWVDVRRAALQSYDPATGRHMARRVAEGMLIGSMAMRRDGGFLLATNSGFYTYDPDANEPPRPLFNPEPDLPGNRLNDGRCDRRGRFWVGSMVDAERIPGGKLYCLEPDLRCRTILEGIVVPNSIAWSPDDRTMYFADTHRQLIWAFDYDPDDGVVTRQRVFKDWSHQKGRPDGAAIDEDGCLWTAMVASGQVIRHTPDGEVDRVIQLPVSNPTCPAFGGDNLDIMFVTSHSQRLGDQLSREPLAGGLFAIHTGCRGLPEPRFAG
ncbi:SMP-30/gluconolactonase/LRE family protein [Pigmentiphaga sp.]|uniref:SMP-30/gluconolactonase/LRE family protein n=1 Tax=Pigmentiphaga sp. TaxID=1977564 RepID=UPI0025E03541|nr:SMP-30/gluconolactonase/LRE family protein [Pigmentiphaga sp.]MBX6317735.1 SMP-30/gluconolactonase/LRE family protein [Pigmentiphaga sp.]